MYLRFPRHIPMQNAIAFSGMVAVVQVMEGTTPFLAVASFAWLVLSVLAFNLAGGLEYPSGAYVTAGTVLTLTLGMLVKVVLGEPFQRNLLTPEKTISVYVVGLGAMAGACYVNSLFRPRRALLAGMDVQNGVRLGAICLLVALIVPPLLPAALQSTFQQANYFITLAILLPVYDTARLSNGWRTFTWVGFSAWALSVYYGLVTFSKEGMFVGGAAWAIGAVAAGYHASAKKIIIVMLVGTAAASILTPYSQVGRNFGQNLPPGLALSLGWNLLSHPLDLRSSYGAQTKADQITKDNSYHLFDDPQGLLDRLNMFAVDDALINLTDKGNKAPASDLWAYFVNLVPRYLNPEKPVLRFGTQYAKPLGMVGEDDDTTGISFGPFADGYHTALWTGVTLYSFGIFLFSFFICDAVGGRVSESFWSLLYVMYFIHAAPETMLGGPVYAAGTLTFFVVAIALFCSKLLPIFASILGTSARPDPREFATDKSHVQSA